MFLFSTGLKNDILGTSSLSALLTDGIVSLYAGTIPATAQDSIGQAVLLNTYTDNSSAVGAGNGLNFATPTGGSISKDAAQVWSGVAVATGTSTFFRFHAQADTGTLSQIDVRIQGTVGGNNADMFVQTNVITLGVNYTIDYFNIIIPV